MSIASQLTALNTDKTAIVSAITAKGGTVSQNAGFDTFAQDIESIPAEAEIVTKLLRREITNLTSDYFQGLTSVPSYAFIANSGIQTVTLPDTITSIGAYAFDACLGLTNFSFGNAPVTTINTYAFFGSNNIINLVIPASVTEIKDSALSYGNQNHKATITFLRESPYVDPTASNPVPTIVSGTFGSSWTSKLAAIYVPATSVNDYKTAPIWSNFASVIQAIPE